MGAQRGMFEPERSQWQAIDAPDAQIALLHGFLDPSTASSLLALLLAEVQWRSDTIEVFGRRHPLPRLHQWYGEPGKVYTWSGIRMEPLPWSKAVMEVRRRVELATGVRFDAVLVNLYRDGDDTVGWHADDEPELGVAPVIASVSLGAERDFVLRHRDPAVGRVCLRLPHGSLLWMAGETQACWQHALPRRRRVREPRVNLTFRAMR